MADEPVITAPFGQRFVVGPKAGPVLLGVIVRAGGHALEYISLPLSEGAVEFEKLG